MLASLTLAPPFVDADRRGGNRDGGGRPSARWWLIIALIATGILWQLVRLVVKG